MKKPSSELVDAFFAWFRTNPHSKNEDIYAYRVTRDALSAMSREQLVEFFFQFARDGGKIQSGGHRTAPRFRRAIEENYDAFRQLVLEPFEAGFDEVSWLGRTGQFFGFGQGLATIYLNRIDKRRFAIVNNKAVEAVKLLGVAVPGALEKKYQAIRDAERQLIEWFPEFDNFYRADALSQFLIGEMDGRPWADALRGKSGAKRRYWIYAPGEDARLWEKYLAEETMGVGWNEINQDLSAVTSESALRELYETTYAGNVTEEGFRQLADFLFNVQVGDHVFVKQGVGKLVGYGEVTSGYIYEAGRPEYRHIRKAKWERSGSWAIPEGMKGLPQKTLTEVRDSERIQSLLQLVGEATRGTFAESAAAATTTAAPYALAELARDTYMPIDDLERWVHAIRRKRQAILYGPPGTGKTYLARLLARHLIGGGDGFFDVVQFHPSYAYEDFMQGLRPTALKGGGLEYRMVPGRFKEFCEEAAKREDPCVLVIDEINRANLARVFGELMYLLEYRDESVPLAGGSTFRIPGNVLIIGTMNTADRSIALVDHALRRRFAFLSLYPNYDVLRGFHASTGFDPEGLIGVLERVNAAINDRHYSVGVSFFLEAEFEHKARDIWQTEIEPYIDELFFDQPDKAANFAWDKIQDEIVGA